MTAPNAAQKQFAPTGMLRVALNHGNRILVSPDEAGHPRSISVDPATRHVGSIINNCYLQILPSSQIICSV